MRKLVLYMCITVCIVVANGCSTVVPFLTVYNAGAAAAVVQVAHSSSSSRSPYKQRQTPHSSPLRQQQQQQQQQSHSLQRQLFSEEERSVTEFRVSKSAASDSPVHGDTPQAAVSAVVALQTAVAAAVGDVSSVSGQLAAVGKQFDMLVTRLQVTAFALRALLPLLMLYCCCSTSACNTHFGVFA
jgi:hypothetical protein